jgi:hypothetical protein
MRVYVRCLLLATVSLLDLAGCAKTPDPKRQAAELEKAFPAAAQTPAATGQAEPGAVAPASGSQANAYVNAALTAVRSNDLAGAVVLLDNVVRQPGLTADQLIAAHEARRAWIGGLTTRAAQGDESAKAALATIEKARSQ